MIKLIRWPNLLIVFITQWIVWSHLICKALLLHNTSSSLNYFHFTLLSLCTIMVAAGGYIINDIKDVKIDLINKPQKVIVGKHLTSQFCISYYYSLLLVGLLISIYLGWSLNKMPFVILYPIFSGLLHLYATKFKKSFLLGNLLISLFVACVPVLIYLAEFEGVNQLHHKRLLQVLLLYCTLAFLSNFIREVVKDLQDLKGDRAFGANTFPIRFGQQSTKILLSTVLVVIVGLILLWVFVADWPNQSTLSIAIGTGPLILISIVLFFTLPKIESPKQFGSWGNGVKLFMLFGLVFLYLQSA